MTNTYYGSDIANGTISTACTMSTTTGGTEVTKTSTWSGGNHFAEVWSQSGSSTPVTAIPSTPTGHGWVTAAPGAGSFATGNWSASIALALTSGASVSWTVRFFKYSSGSYTSIGTIATSAASMGSSRTVISFTATSMSTVTFGASDLLYVDLWMQDTTGAGGDNAIVYESNSSTAGVANDVQITTSTFTPAGTVVNKDITVRGKVSAGAFKDITVRGKLSAIGFHDVTVRGKVGNTIYKDIATRAKVSAVVFKDITVRGKLSQLTHKDVTVRGKIGNTTFKDVTARGKLSAVGFHDVTVRGKVGLFAFHDITVRGKVGALVFKDIAVRGKIAPVAYKDITTRGKVSAKGFHDITVRGKIIARNTSGGITVWSNGTGTATFDHFRATQYPDPALSLAPVIPRIGTSLVQWNALVPTNTTLGIDLSTDGVNWTDVSALSGQTMPQFFVQPDPTIDGFASNTSANYTSTFRTGGSALTATFDTANSRIILTGGTNAIYVNSAISRADVDFFADLDQSDAGGMVWRYVDANDFYYLLIADNQASSGTPNTITLYRVASNVQTQLAQANITFYRGLHYRFRVAMLGSVITASLDGTQLISYTDGSSITSAGKVGLFNSGGTVGSRYSLLWIQPQGDLVTRSPQGDIVTGTFVYTRARLATTDPTATPQVEDLTTLAAGPNIRNGVQLATVSYNAAYIGKTYDDLAKASAYAWYIGVDSSGNKTLYFRQSTAIPSPWILQSNNLGLGSDLEQDTNLVIETANNTLYRNRQILLNVIATATFSNTFVGDGKATTFTLSYPLASGFIPTITLNGIVQKVGMKGTTGAQWYYAAADPVIAEDAAGIVLQASDSLVVSPYQGTYITNVTVDNVAAQQALKAIQGGTGIVEEVEDVSSMGLNVAAALTYGQQLLDRNCIPGGRTATFKTYRQGIDILQTLTAFVEEEGVNDVQLLVTEVDTYLQTSQLNGATAPLYGFIAIATELPYIASWPALLARNLLDG